MEQGKHRLYQLLSHILWNLQQYTQLITDLHDLYDIEHRFSQ